MIALVNQTSLLLNINLAQPRSLASTTMRKGRTAPVALRIEPGQQVNISTYLNVSDDEARAVLKASDEVHQGCLKGRLVVIDGSEVVQGVLQKIDYIDYPPLSKPAEPEEKYRNERVIDSGARMLEEKSSEEANLAKDAGISPSVDISDSMPSARWSRERLMQYAEDRGIKIPETMSRNAILKKLRS